MADFNIQKMVTNFSIWTYDEKEKVWKGVCKECKSEKAQYTPEVLKKKNISPCSLCTTIDKKTKEAESES